MTPEILSRDGFILITGVGWVDSVFVCKGYLCSEWTSAQKQPEAMSVL